ncbi:2,4-dienoyl-CoA reductase [Alicyclobacillus herbarius]|uniref:2,4-dienoyl-CoA reductase n=1 Tax=Alicyclobacillus herbarius TaxID=122960 RepID=UPI0004036576|nr:2,4-dienoyl-CoA reductase [Alicyclobacillus herbarius]
MFVPDAFSGQTAIVTGGGTGIGRAIARKLAHLGANVVVASRKLENLERVVQEIEADGGHALAVAMDVRQPEDVSRTLDAAIERFGSVQHLVNNAAGNFICPAEKLTQNGWRAVLGIVLDGTFYCSQTVGKHWIAAGQRGTITNIVATYAWGAGPGVVHSASAKAGVLAMTRTLAVEWGRFGIRVNAIAPGPIAGTGGEAHLFPTEADKLRMAASVPLGRLGTPEEIAAAAVFLLSPEAAYISGECLTVDGARWLNHNLFQASSSAK